MEKPILEYPRILAIAPSTRGFGFAVLEGLNVLVDWGVRADKSNDSISKVEVMIAHYQPNLIALEDFSVKSSRRSGRALALSKCIIQLTETRGINLKVFSREQIRRAFLGNHRATKYAIAETIAKRFPDELSFRLPPKRRPWESQDSRMDIFDAVALALMIGKVTRE